MEQAFGKYRLRELLARGGMAEIHLAVEQTAHTGERLVVLKRILPDHKDDPDFVEFFVHEARVALQLTHPNIVQAYEFGRENDVLYLAMEYVRGFTVLDVIRRASMLGRSVSLDAVVKIAADIAAGLDYAHKATDAQGRPLEIVHRDVSPHNVVIAREGTAKLVDFGIARASCQMFKTRTGVIKGKFAYLAPEQLRRNARFDHRADLFALGTVTYEMLTRRPLFRGSNDADTVKRILAGRIPPLRELRPDCPVPIAAVVHRALERDPEERYQSGSEMLADLEEAARASGLFPTMTRLRGELESLFEEAAPTSIWTSMSARPPASDPNPGQPPGEDKPRSEPPPGEPRASEPRVGTGPARQRPSEPRVEPAPPRARQSQQGLEPLRDASRVEPRSDIRGEASHDAHAEADAGRAEGLETEVLPDPSHPDIVRMPPRAEARADGRSRPVPRASPMPGMSGLPASIPPNRPRPSTLPPRPTTASPSARASSVVGAGPSAAAGSGDVSLRAAAAAAAAAAESNGGASRTAALSPVLPGPLTVPMPAPEDLPRPLLPAPRLASPRLDDVSPDPIPDRQLEYFLRLASARRSRADTLGLVDPSPNARLNDESLALLYEEENGEPVEHLLGAVPEPTLPVDTAPVHALDDLPTPFETPSLLPLRAPPHMTPPPGLDAAALAAVGLDAAVPRSGSVFEEPRPVTARPVLRDVGLDTGEQTALAAPGLSGTIGAGSAMPPRPPIEAFASSASQVNPLDGRLRRRQRLILIAVAVATAVVAVVAYGLVAG